MGGFDIQNNEKNKTLGFGGGIIAIDSNNIEIEGTLDCNGNNASTN